MSKSEDASDVRAYDEAKRRLETREDELIPAEFAHRILDGESPVKVYREYRGLGRDELAAKAGIEVETLDQIERGEQSERGAMERIAQILELNLDDL